MLESSVSDRIIFPSPDGQTRFLLSAREKLGLTWTEWATTLGVHPRTVRDWARGKKRMPFSTAEKISQETSIPLDKKVKRLSWKEHTYTAGLLGGIANMAMNGQVGGDEEYRKEKWRTWWKKEGQFVKNSITQPKEISLPKKNVRLAEFVGIMMGDGGVTKYHATITLDSKNDKEYSYFVAELITDLFKIIPGRYEMKTCRAVNIVMNRINIVKFCQEIGLRKGNKLKQGLDIPEWIKGNRKFEIACVRGLVDTDGCVFKHSYVVNGKRYEYMKIAFTSKSPMLINSVRSILTSLGITSRISKDKNDVRIDGAQDVQKYFTIIGSHNPKYAQRVMGTKYSLR
jgi:hypothetical protein